MPKCGIVFYKRFMKVTNMNAGGGKHRNLCLNVSQLIYAFRGSAYKKAVF